MARNPYDYMNTASATGTQTGKAANKIGGAQYPGGANPFGQQGAGLGTGLNTGQANQMISGSQYPGATQTNPYYARGGQQQQSLMPMNKPQGTWNNSTSMNGMGGMIPGGQSQDFGMSVDMGMGGNQGQNRGGGRPPSGAYPNPDPVSNIPFPTNYTPVANPMNNPGSALPVNPMPITGNNDNIIYDPNTWADKVKAEQYQKYLDNTIPYQQLQQNQYQYGSDFNEAQRRWNEDMMRQQGNDQFQQGLSRDQMSLAQWNAQTANSQWQEQFGAQRQNDLYGQNLAAQQQAAADQQQGWQQQFQGGQQQWNQNIQQQQQNLGMKQADIESQYKQGLITAQQAQNATDLLNVQNQYSLGQGQNQNAATQNAQQYALGQGQNANQLLNYQNQYQLGQDQNWNTAQQNMQQYELGKGRLNTDFLLGDARNANDARGLDIQSQLNQGNLGLGQGRLGLDTQLGVGTLQLNQQRMLQEAQMAAEQRATSERIAAMGAFGRAQAPTARFVTNW